MAAEWTDERAEADSETLADLLAQLGIERAPAPALGPQRRSRVLENLMWLGAAVLLALVGMGLYALAMPLWLGLLLLCAGIGSALVAESAGNGK